MYIRLHSQWHQWRKSQNVSFPHKSRSTCLVIKSRIFKKKRSPQISLSCAFLYVTPSKTSSCTRTRKCVKQQQKKMNGAVREPLCVDFGREAPAQLIIGYLRVMSEPYTITVNMSCAQGHHTGLLWERDACVKMSHLNTPAKHTVILLQKCVLACFLFAFLHFEDIFRDMFKKRRRTVSLFPSVEGSYRSLSLLLVCGGGALCFYKAPTGSCCINKDELKCIWHIDWDQKDQPDFPHQTNKRV